MQKLVFALLAIVVTAESALIRFAGWGRCRDEVNEEFTLVRNTTDSFGCMMACFADEGCVGYEVDLGKCKKNVCNMLYPKYPWQGPITQTEADPALACYKKTTNGTTIPTARPTSIEADPRFALYEEAFNHCRVLKKGFCKKDERCVYNQRNCMPLMGNPTGGLFQCLGRAKVDCVAECLYNAKLKFCAVNNGTCEQITNKRGCKGSGHCKWKSKACRD
jgi:hypothetical protein